MNKSQFSALTLPDVLAQIVEYATDDYRQSNKGMPEDVQWNVSYICACFLAQHTVHGNEGVDTECPFTDLKVANAEVAYKERLRLAKKLVKSWGGVLHDKGLA